MVARVETSTEVLTADEAAALLKMNADKVRKLTRSGVIPGRRIGGAYRYYRTSLMSWLSGEASVVQPKLSRFLPPVKRTMSERV